MLAPAGAAPAAQAAGLAAQTRVLGVAHLDELLGDRPVKAGVRPGDVLVGQRSLLGLGAGALLGGRPLRRAGGRGSHAVFGAFAVVSVALMGGIIFN